MYPATSIWQLCVNIQAYLRMKGRHVSLLKDVNHKPIQDALDVAIEHSSQMAVYYEKQADTISREDEDQMWESGILGTSDAKTHLHTLMYALGYSFALRASDHRNLNVQIQVSTCIHLFLYFILHFLFIVYT